MARRQASRTRNPKGSGDKLRTELLAAANEVLDRTGDPASVTIRGIAAAVGVAPNAVYLHFADRDALLTALAADRFAAFGDHIRSAMTGVGPDPLERLRRGHAAYVDFALTHAGHYRLLFGGVQPHDDHTLELGLAAFELLVEGCRGIIDAGLVGEVDPYELAASLWAFEHGYVELVRTGVGNLPGPIEALDAVASRNDAVMTEYEEFGLLHENASEAGIPLDPLPVRRAQVDGVSAIVWGEEGDSPEIVLLHGGAQNAHTWDTVALALQRPILAVDLPGHGHSDWTEDHDYRPSVNAPAVAEAVAALAPDAEVVVGMSLGGLTAAALAGIRPDLVRRLVLVDVTPGVNREKAADIIAFVSGPETFESFDAILERTIQFNPTRTESSLRRGVLHNAKPLPDGTWTWRYDRMRVNPIEGEEAADELAGLWDVLGDAKATGPLLLARGATSPVVDDADVAELLRRRPDAEVVGVDRAGHSIQGDRPLALAALVDGWASRPV